MAHRLGLEWSASEIRDRLEAGSEGLRRVADELLATGPTTHQQLLVSIDQAEELFTRTTPLTLQRFAHLLHDAVAGPVRVVAAMRSEFLDDLRALPALAGVPIEVYLLAPLEREMLRDVIEQPAKIARLRLEDGLVAALVSDTNSGEALPLLAFVLRQLAEGLPVGGRLTHSRYHDLGGVRGALTRHADTALTDALQASGLTEPEVLAGLTRLVTVDEAGRRGRRRLKLTSLPQPLRVALRVFMERRLLLSNTDDEGQVWLTVAHEALLTEWRPLDTATANITAALRIARTVEQAATDWHSAGRPEHYLWDHKRLATTLTTLGLAGNGDSHNPNPAASPIVELDDQAGAFLDATARRVQATQQRERRRRTRTLTVLCILLVLALAAGGVAIWQQQRARSAQYMAITRGMLAQADRIRDRDPRIALQLGVAARQLDNNPQAHASLQQTLTSTPHFRTLRGHTGPVSGVAFAPDGRTLATTSADQTVRLWDLSDRDHPHPLGLPLTGHTNEVSGVAFSPDGRTLATTSADRTVRLWDLSDRDHPHPLGLPLTGHTNEVSGVAFSPDGRTLATSGIGFDQTVRLWDLSDRDYPRQLGSPLTSHDPVMSVAFAADGRTLVTSSTWTVRLWDLSDRHRPHPLGPPLTDHTDAIGRVAFAPDGRTLAITSYDRTVRLWDLSDRNRPHLLVGIPLTGHTGPVSGVAFAPDGRTLATASTDQTAIVWDLSDRDRPHPLGPPLTGHTGPVLRVAFAPGGRTLATTSMDQTAIVWDLSDRDRPHPLGPPLTGHTGPVYGVAFAPDGRILATTSTDHTVRLWDLSDRTRVHPLGPPLTGHTGPVHEVAFAPNGRTLATTSMDQTVRLWDLSDRTRVHPLGPPLTGHTGSVYGVAFAPDGRTLATSSDDQTVRLWDLSDRDRPHPMGPPLTGHTGAVVRVAFAPDGRTLITVSADHSVRLWDLPRLDRFPGGEVREACARAGGPLDKATWGLYAPGLSYQDTCADH
jgi:WD40 repeat protein